MTHLAFFQQYFTFVLNLCPITFLLLAWLSLLAQLWACCLLNNLVANLLRVSLLLHEFCPSVLMLENYFWSIFRWMSTVVGRHRVPLFTCHSLNVFTGFPRRLALSCWIFRADLATLVVMTSILKLVFDGVTPCFISTSVISGTISSFQLLLCWGKRLDWQPRCEYRWVYLFFGPFLLRRFTPDFLFYAELLIALPPLPFSKPSAFY